MAKGRVLLTLVAYLVALNHSILGQGCQDNSQNELEAQFEIMENQITTLSEAVKNAAFSIMAMEKTFHELKIKMATMNTTNESTDGSNKCSKEDLFQWLEEYLNNQKVNETACTPPPDGGDSNTGDKGDVVSVIYSCREANKTGIYTLKLNDTDEVFQVLCVTDYENGGWLVIQNRFNGSVDFYRNWSDYKIGFGDINGEFWLGNDKIHKLTKAKARDIRFLLSDWDDKVAVAKYAAFQIGDENQKYFLRSLGQYSGTAGDSLSRNVNSKFTTRDADNDSSDANCANLYFGGWWYDNCHLANLNGKYVKGAISEYATMMCWNSFKGFYYGLKTSRIMIQF
ncbi:ficolin-2-like [Toxorhynchites rutilus septentrionalis]|uniref:ficolin-2-like n=1 Tax=Toxorhynchites rutilus septentrionalis TaxID=329112 RepID=UPI00247AFE3E|nr:ficolin-2-like [Toxorhynchites rutilus septentrionalis]